MIATWVPARLTPLTFDEASAALASALRDQLEGKAPSRETLALACAKSALETGRWRSIWNSNFGNIKAGEQYAGNYCTIELNEVLKGQVVWFSPRGRLDRKGGKVVAEPFDDPPGHPQTRMRAYANRFDGALSYVNFVAGGRYTGAWQKLLAGDALGYVHALKLAGYFTADEATYAKSVVSMQREFLGKLAGQAPDTHEPEDHEWEAIRASIQGHSLERIQDSLGTAADNQREFDADDEPPPGAA
jgi:hypothetical protein